MHRFRMYKKSSYNGAQILRCSVLTPRLRVDPVRNMLIDEVAPLKKLIAYVSAALCAIGFSLAIAVTVQAATAEDIIIERIKPAGKVCLQGDDSCGGAATAVAATSGSSGRSGEDIAVANCNACHVSGVLGAPKVGTGDWAARLNDKGLDMLVANAINGINAMPPRGTCGDCSDDEIKAATEYMIEASK